MFMPDDIKELQLQKLLRGFHKDEALCFALEGAYYKRASEKIKDLSFQDCRFYYAQRWVKAKIRERAVKLAGEVVHGTVKTWDGLLGKLDDWMFMDRQSIRKGQLNGN